MLFGPAPFGLRHVRALAMRFFETPRPDQARPDEGPITEPVQEDRTGRPLSMSVAAMSALAKRTGGRVVVDGREVTRG